MAESRQQLQTLSDEALGRVLNDFSASVAFPSGAGEAGRPDVAARARAQILALGTRPAPVGGRRPFGIHLRPMRRGLVLALAALLILAAIAGAVGLGLPGLRLVFGDAPSPRPSATATATSASPGPLGSNLGLGAALPLADVERLAGIDFILPTDPTIGPPEAAYISGRRAALVWSSGPGLPATSSDGVGLLVSEFRGLVESGYYEKLITSNTVVTRVTVNGSPGFWISGEPHFFYYVDPDGDRVEDTHREVGNALIWSTGEVSYRLESGLDMAEAIRLAESFE